MLYFVTGTPVGNTCTTDADCVAVTDATCSTTCQCPSGTRQYGTACRIGKFKRYVLSNIRVR